MNHDSFEFVSQAFDAFAERVGKDHAGEMVIAHQINMFRVELSATRKQVKQMREAIDRISANTAQLVEQAEVGSES